MKTPPLNLLVLLAVWAAPSLGELLSGTHSRAGAPPVTEQGDHRVIVRFANSGTEALEGTLLERKVHELQVKAGVLHVKGLMHLCMAVAFCESLEAEERLVSELEADPLVDLVTPDTLVYFDAASRGAGTIRRGEESWKRSQGWRQCSAQPSCAALHSAGECCPTTYGIMLSCCDAQLRTLIALRSFFGKYMVAGEDGSTNANREELSSWSKFELIRNKDGTVSLRSSFGKYLCAEIWGTVNANRKWLRSWEKFELIENGDSTVSLKTFWGAYLVAKADGALKASSWFVGDGAKFQMIELEQRFPNDQGFSALWGMNNPQDTDIDAPEAWKIFSGESSAGIIVAVMDTGIDYAHADLAGNMWVNPSEIPGNGIDDDRDGHVDDVHGVNFVSGGGDPMDDNGHGTHGAGTIAGMGNNGIGVAGVAWHGVRLMALKFLGASGEGKTSDAVRALDYAVAHGARIASNSWGGAGSSAALRAAIERAEAAGLLFVAAAGNSGTDNDEAPHYPSSYAAASIIAVAATASDGRLSSFSCYGGASVDVAAPGSRIYSTAPFQRYQYLSGTSMATPHVSGLAALVWLFRPSLSMLQVKEILLDSVKRLPDLEGRVATGGRINARKALLAASALEPPRRPLHAPQALAFQDTDPKLGMISGTVSITAAADESDVEYYKVYFASSAGFQLGAVGNARHATGARQLEIIIGSPLAIPKYATGLVAVSGNSTGEMGALAGDAVPGVKLEDYVVPECGPEAVSWGGDLDLRPGFVAGRVAVARAPHERTLSHYNVYWSSGPGSRHHLLGSLPAAGFEVPTCSGDACALISRTSITGGVRFNRGRYGNGEDATITASGPATVRIMRFQTEGIHDSLQIGLTRISGHPTLPMEVNVGASKFSVSWHSDGSVVESGWTFEIFQKDFEAEFQVGAAGPGGQGLALQGSGLEVVAAHGHTELPEGTFVTVEDYDRTMPPSPGFKPAAVSFVDTDNTSGVLAGTALVFPAPGAAAAGSAVGYYHLNFADAEGRALDQGWRGAAGGSRTVLFPIGPTAMPAGASRLVARAGNDFGLGAGEASAELVDVVSPRMPESGPKAVWWVGDVDLRPGFVAGRLVVARAPSERFISQYNVYSSNDTGSRGQLLGSLPASSFEEPRCMGDACSLISQTDITGGKRFDRDRYRNREDAQITASGPATVRITRLQTESEYDFLQIGLTKLSGHPAVPFEMEVSAAKFSIVWTSDSGITGAGWTLELIQKDWAAEFQIGAAEPPGHGLGLEGSRLEVVAANGRTELPQGTSVGLEDYNRTMPPSPAFAPVAVSFEDTDSMSGIVAGTIHVLPVPGTDAMQAIVTYYQLNFADIEGRQLGGGWRVAASGNSTVLLHIGPVPVPAGASQLVARAGNDFGVGPGKAFTELRDLVSPSAPLALETRGQKGLGQRQAGVKGNMANHTTASWLASNLEPWLRQSEATEQREVVWPEEPEALFPTGSGFRRRILGAIRVPQLDARLAKAQAVREAFRGAIVAALHYIAEEDVRIVRVLAVVPAKETAQRKPGHAHMTGTTTVEFEVAPIQAAPKRTLDLVEARLILLGMGGGSWQRFNSAMLARLGAVGIVLPVGTRALVKEPQLVEPKRPSRRLTAAAPVVMQGSEFKALLQAPVAAVALAQDAASFVGLAVIVALAASALLTHRCRLRGCQGVEFVVPGSDEL